MGRHAPRHAPVHEYDWLQAVPVSVAASVWQRSKYTILGWCNSGKVAAWKPGSEWFVSSTSMLRLCGIPANRTLLLEKLPHLR